MKAASRPCDECRNFAPWISRHGDVPDDYNPCAKGHAMHFKEPEDLGDLWGFFRRKCEDRVRC